MSTATVLLIAIPLMVVLALAIAFTSARRRDSAGLGHLSRETASRARSPAWLRLNWSPSRGSASPGLPCRL